MIFVLLLIFQNKLRLQRREALKKYKLVTDAAGSSLTVNLKCALRIQSSYHLKILSVTLICRSNAVLCDRRKAE